MSDTTKAQAKHTPGPWRAEGWRGMVVNAADGSTILAMPGGSYGAGETELNANARLIAAAPAMLAALEDIAGRGPVLGYGSAGALLIRLAGIQSIARAALSAATGEG